MAVMYTNLKAPLQVDYTADHPGGKMEFLHYHNAYEIYILEKGERTYLIDGTLISLREREAVLIRPFELHSTDGSVYSRYALYFKEEYLDRYFSPEGKEALLAPFSQRKLTLDSERYTRLSSLLTELNAKPEDFLLLGEILRLLYSCRDIPSPYASEEGSLIARITAYIGQHYLTLSGLDELAKHFYVTKSYLCRLFKKETSLSVITYVNALKLQKATEELRFTRKSVKQVALDCGFHSSVYFCRLFRESLSLSPAEYRRKYQN